MPLLVIPLLMFLGIPAHSGENYQDSPAHQTVKGVVVNAVSGVPISGASVKVIVVGKMLVPDEFLKVQARPDGRFEIKNVPEGRVIVAAQHAAFFQGRGDEGSAELNVGPGQNEVRLQLTPFSRITGRVTAGSGEPVSGTEVVLYSMLIAEGNKRWERNIDTLSKEDGTYHFDNLRSAQFIVFTNGQVVEPRNPNEINVPSYYPGAVDLATAQPIDLLPGQEFRADCLLRTEPGFRVTGRVIGLPDTSNALVRISVKTTSGDSLFSEPVRFDSKLSRFATHSDSISFDPKRGQFEARNVPSGKWIVEAWGPDPSDGSKEIALNMYGREQIVVDNADVSDLEIVFHRLPSIPVVVNLPSTLPAAATEPNQIDALTDALISHPGLDFWVRSTEPMNYTAKAMEIDAGERVGFVFSKLIFGRYHLSAVVKKDACVESARYGTHDLLQEDLVVTPDTRADPITITLRSDCATIVGKLPAGYRQKSGFLLARPTFSPANPSIMSIGPPSQGFSNSLILSPGQYRIFAFTDLEGLEYANPGSLSKFPSKTVDLQPSQKIELTVSPIELPRRSGSPTLH